MSVYCCSDLHGCYDLYEQINKFLKPEDIVYFLGDATDRGSEGWRLLKAIAANPQWKYIKGNHEDMLVDAMRDFIKYDSYDTAYQLLVYNGGYATFSGWLAEDEKFYESWMNHINKFPTYDIYTNKDNIHIILSHAGFTPTINHQTGHIEIPEDRDLIWNREHFNEKWNNALTNFIVVHGHTPTESLVDYLHEDEFRDIIVEPGALWYCENHKVCIDCGSVWSGYTVLLDLDTFDEHIFENEYSLLTKENEE